MSKLLPALPLPKVAGLMQETPLLIAPLIQHAERNYPLREIVSRLPEHNDRLHRSNYKTAAARSRQLANALTKDFGITEGDIIGTLSYNHIYHFECYFGISGIGAILHTVNPRLFPEQLQYIINHAEDTILCVDYACVPVLANLVKTHGVNCNRVIVLTSSQYYGQCQQQLVEAATSRSGYQLQVSCYEDVIRRHSTQFEWPVFHDFAAATLCYTSGTTGNPKGVLYSHRSTVIHAIMLMTRDVLQVWSHDSILVNVPLFHVSGWGLPFAACASGAKLVFPGTKLDGKSLTELLASEQCTVTLGVPTVHLSIFQHLDSPEGKDIKLPHLERVIISGSAASESMLTRYRRMGVATLHLWGMTELNPIGTTGVTLAKHKDWTEDELFSRVLRKAGREIYTVEKRIVDVDGKQLPRDGTTSGNLQVRGPHTTRAYFRVNKKGEKVPSGQEDANVDDDGWLTSGDVGTLDEDGYLQITDRSKDVIKSGGEWISSIDIENIVMGHPAVAEACVIGHHHTKWQERPLLFVVKKGDQQVTADEVFAYLKPKIISWWMPNGIVFVEELPHTATGKLSKLTVRKQFKDYVFPDDKQHPQHQQKQSKL